MTELFYDPGTASMVPHIVLEEIGAPYRRVLVDRMAQAHKRPEFLKLNPNGLIPVLRQDDLVVYETAAIVLHLCDTHPAAGLAPAIGTPQRAHFYQWLAWLTNTLQATLVLYFYPERSVNEGNAAGADEVKARAEAKVAGLLDQLDTELARRGGPWFLGDSYSALDAYVFTMCRWTRNFRHETPARGRPHLQPYLERMMARPALQRVMANEQLAPPYF
ncbi:MAG TPA: glutathione S-transferase family protein [Ramlibacter sp.]|nr:glutathione S-transferase family protein [Ramlibacter sp.]